MSLRETVRKQLKQLAQTPHGARREIRIETGNVQLSCHLTALDAIGCAFETLQLRSEKLVSADAKKLKQVGKLLADRLNYLLEPIEPLEFDEQACVLQLRSNPPSQDDEARTYFELAINQNGTIVLSRYEKMGGQQRRNIPANVTREMLERLIVDLCDVAG
jgi:hypothetical protein